MIDETVVWKHYEANSAYILYSMYMCIYIIYTHTLTYSVYLEYMFIKHYQPIYLSIYLSLYLYIFIYLSIQLSVTLGLSFICIQQLEIMEKRTQTTLSHNSTNLHALFSSNTKSSFDMLSYSKTNMFKISLCTLFCKLYVLHLYKRRIFFNTNFLLL